jgi:CAAX protease family protein
MYENFSKKIFSYKLTSMQKAILLPIWVIVTFFLSQLFLVPVIIILELVGLWPGEKAFDDPVFNTVVAAFVYGVSLLLTVGVPWVLLKKKTTKREIGLWRLPSWMDILLAPAGIIVYFITSAIFLYIATKLIPSFNQGQTQDIPFKNLVQNYQYFLAFITLVVIAPLAEETLFRGYLYGKLRKFRSVWASTLITSILFGIVHLQWNVGVDVFALSIVMCTLREISGTIWPGVLMHMMKNGLAFYLLFINPSLLHIMSS